MVHEDTKHLGETLCQEGSSILVFKYARAPDYCRTQRAQVQVRFAGPRLIASKAEEVQTPLSMLSQMHATPLRDPLAYASHGTYVRAITEPLEVNGNSYA